jgi:PAS domain S-box-containing protein
MANETILVVEDDGISGAYLQNVLIRMGYQVPHVADTGEEAVAAAGRLRPDLVLMDIGLAGDMDGIEAASKIREAYDIPVIYLTALSDDKTLQEAKITEPHGYIVKPFLERILHITIEVGIYKHQMEKRIRDNERWLATTLGSIGDAVVAANAQGEVAYMNKEAMALTGWSLEEAMGQNLALVVRMADLRTKAPVRHPVFRAVSTGEPVASNVPALLLAKDGREIPVDHGAAPLRGDKGEITGVVLTFRDITGRRAAEEALRVAEFALENAGEAVFWLNTDGRVIRANRKARDSLGYTREELSGKNIRDIDSGFAGDGWERCLAALAGEGASTIASSQTRKDGTAFPVETTLSRLVYEGREFVCAFAREMGGREKAQAALAESRARYRTLFERVPVGVGITTVEGMLLDCNRLLEEITGFALADAKTMHIAEFYARPLERPRLIGELKKRGRLRDYSTDLKRKDGSTYHALLNADLVEVNGELMSLFSVRDVTGQVLAQKRLEEAERRLRLANADLAGEVQVCTDRLIHSEAFIEAGKLAASIAHEVNSPLAGIGLMLDAMSGECKGNGKLSADLALVAEAFQNVRATIEGFLDLARPGKAEMLPVGLNSIAKKSAGLVQGQARKAGIEIVFDPAPEDPVVPGSPRQLGQVVLNLLNNAIEAVYSVGAAGRPDKTAASGGEVRLRTWTRGGRAYLSLEDTGPGIPEENLEKVFDPFFTKKTDTGMGMGLYVSRGIVTAHGGRIWAENRPGGGAVFTVALPLV